MIKGFSELSNLNNIWSVEEIKNIESSLCVSFEFYLLHEIEVSPDYPNGLCREITVKFLQNQIAELKEDKDMSMMMLGFDTTGYCSNSLINAIDWDMICSYGESTCQR